MKSHLSKIQQKKGNSKDKKAKKFVRGGDPIPFELTWERDGASTRNFLAKKYPCSSKGIGRQDPEKFLAFYLCYFYL